MEYATEITVNVKDCATRRTYDEGYTAPPVVGMSALRDLVDVLNAAGLETSVKISPRGGRATLRIHHSDAHATRMRRTRGAGRKKAVVTAPHTLEWYDAHTPEEGAADMGVSVRTYYRRIKAMRDGN